MSEQDKQCREAFECAIKNDAVHNDMDMSWHALGGYESDYTQNLFVGFQLACNTRAPQITATKNESGQIVAVTRTDAEGKILEVIAESEPQAQFTDEAFEKLFEQFADLYNQESNEWLDMDVQTAFVAGCKAIAARCGDAQTKEKAEMWDWFVRNGMCLPSECSTGTVKDWITHVKSAMQKEKQ